MFSENDARSLAEFSAGGFLLTSLYFQAPKAANRAHRDELIRLKQLFREARRQWEKRDIEPRKIESLEKDTEQMLEALSIAPANGSGGRDMALFSCAGRSFFKSLPLPPGLDAGCAGVFVGETFRLRPLVALQDQYPRHCLVMLDRERAFISEVIMGEVEDQSSFKDEVPPRVRATDWGGYRERRIERHADQEAARHYERVVEALVEIFKRRRFDRLLLAGHKESFSEFESHLTEELRKRVVGRFPADPRTAAGDEIHARALEAVHESDRAEKQRLVALVLNNAGPQGLGVLGLDATLEALSKKEVQVLLVGEGFAAGGKRCSRCGYLGGVSRSECPLCSTALERVDDVVDHAVRQALLVDSRIRFIESDIAGYGAGYGSGNGAESGAGSRAASGAGSGGGNGSDVAGFEAGGNIGAVLRYRSESRPPQ